MGQALRRAVLTHRLTHLPAPPAESIEPAALELGRALTGPLVPGGARLRVPLARPRVADDKRADHLRMGVVEVERGVAAQRETADHRSLDAQVLEERLHVGDSEVGRVLRGIARALRLTVPAHAP